MLLLQVRLCENKCVAPPIYKCSYVDGISLTAAGERVRRISSGETLQERITIPETNDAQAFGSWILRASYIPASPPVARRTPVHVIIRSRWHFVLSTEHLRSRHIHRRRAPHKDVTILHYEYALRYCHVFVIHYYTVCIVCTVFNKTFIQRISCI